jgi:hypothetical protein
MKLRPGAAINLAISLAAGSCLSGLAFLFVTISSEGNVGHIALKVAFWIMLSAAGGSVIGLDSKSYWRGFAIGFGAIISPLVLAVVVIIWLSWQMHGGHF